MTRRGAIAPVSVAFVLALALPSDRAEVSVESGQDGSAGAPFVFMALRGHEGPAPWGRIRLHAPSARLLNPDGDGSGDGQPAIAIVPADGTPQIVWSTPGPGGGDIVHAEWGGSGWTGPQTIAGGAPDQRGPDVACRPDGRLAVVWWEDDGAFRQVFLRTRDAQGTWQPEEPVSPSSQAAAWPAVTADGDELWVGWQRDLGDGTREIVVALETQGWNPLVIGQTTYVAADGGLDAHLELHARDGRAWADWLLAPDRIATSRLDPQTGQWTPVEEIPCGDSPEGRDAARFEAKRRALGW